MTMTLDDPVPARPSPRALAELLADRPAVSVTDLVDQAALLTRQDRKYLVPDEEVPALLAALPDLAVLTIGGAVQFGYDTVYLDTPDLSSFRDAARGRPHRWKVRVRSYLDSADAWVEVKVRDRHGNTVKHRLPRSFGAPLRLDGPEQGFARGAAPALDPATLTAVLGTTYRRATLLDQRDRTRTTIDREVRGIDRDGGAVAFVGTTIVETKTAGRPGTVDRALWRLGHRPRRFSKYGTAMAALDRDLPANRWHRTLTSTPWQRDAGPAPAWNEQNERSER